MNSQQKRRNAKKLLGQLRSNLKQAKANKDHVEVREIKYRMAKKMLEVPTSCERILNLVLGNVAANQGWIIERQVFINPYIADFIISNKHVIIEADGPAHVHRQAYDQRRDLHLLGKGYRTIRFSNEQIKENVNHCIEKLIEFV